MLHLKRLSRGATSALLLLLLLSSTLLLFTTARTGAKGAVHRFKAGAHKLTAGAASSWRVGADDSAEQAALRSWELSRATQYLGTGARVQRFLEKAKRGEAFTVAAVGGSGEYNAVQCGAVGTTEEDEEASRW